MCTSRDPRTVDRGKLDGEGDVETFVVLRRSAWQTHDEVEAARVRAAAGVERSAEAIDWVRTYVISEIDGTFGWICLYDASTPEAIRHHATAAALPINEILKVACASGAQPHVAATAARRGGFE